MEVDRVWETPFQRDTQESEHPPGSLELTKQWDLKEVSGGRERERSGERKGGAGVLGQGTVSRSISNHN